MQAVLRFTTVALMIVALTLQFTGDLMVTIGLLWAAHILRYLEK